jgi:hypothetical protein
MRDIRRACVYCRRCSVSPLAAMKSHSATITPPPSIVAKPASLQSSISSIRFIAQPDCASFTSSLEEKDLSCLASTTLKSPITSKQDTGSLYQTLASDVAPHSYEDWGRAGPGLMPELTPCRELDTLSVNTVGTSLTSQSVTSQSTASVLRRHPQLNIKIRWNKSESQELAMAVSHLVQCTIWSHLNCDSHPQHAQAVAMYKDRGLLETQKIFCDICHTAGYKFMLKNVEELTLHLHIHNMPEM